ncbi:MAG: hypothetical protein Tp172MES593141_8 [Prokaryotic dsDNA virus sp.]|nr:MAG: hypothetical protein Tp172MES593141_8 [Prokaryotic dsDNA virus sp.]|tara:strand:- start:11874 stop:13334 length:1461 start_codon:yes stop_codon:yes gene_type:complete
MADKIVIEAEVKSDVGQLGKDVSDAAGEFQILGVSLNSVKAGFVSAGSQAKMMFSSIKAGLTSTGIGAFVVAIGSLVSYFTNTKKGAEQLQVAMAALGAAFNVIVDRASQLGGAIVKLFTGDAKGALEGVKGAFSDIGTEIANDTAKTILLTKAFQKLKDSQRELNVETAEQRAEIERLKLIAEDVTKSTQERLEAAKDAFKIENDLLDRRIANAEEDLRIQRERMETRKVDNEFLESDLDAEAQLRIDLANIQQESTTKQIELNNKINAIEAEAQAKRDAAFEKEKAQNIERTKDLTLMPALVAKVNDELIQANNEYFESLENNADDQKELSLGIEQFKIDSVNTGLELAKQAAGEGTAIAKAAAIAQATIAGTQSVINAFNAANANIGATAGSFGAYPITMAALAAGFAATNIAKIASGSPPSASGGSGGSPEMVPTTPAPQMMSGAFELGGGLAPEPMKAFVVTDEMTNSQDQLANIRRQATI